MEKKLKDYIQFYIGQECLIIGSSKKYTIQGYDLTFSNPVRIADNESLYARKTEDIILSLRPLSSMTEGQALELWNLTGIGNSVEGGNALVYFQNTIHLMPRELHWLIKEGFDLFGLIEDGLAIDSTLNNKQ